MSEPSYTMPNEQAPVAQSPLSVMFVWMELNRRVDAIVRRLEQLDEHGTRGVDALKGEVRQLGKDMSEHEKAHQRTADQQQTNRRWMIGTLIALVTPLYPLLIWLITRGR